MLVTKEQFKNGVIKYIDDEVIPQLPTVGKWGLGAMITLASDSLENVIDTLSKNPLVKSLCIVDDSGQIEIDKLANALSINADKYGKMQLSIPIIGTLTFCSSDIRKVRDCIIGHNYEEPMYG